MQRLGFLISRRWGLFLVAVALLSWLAWELGQWQFDRLEDRRERNAIIERNEARDPVPVEEVLEPGGKVSAQDEWATVRARGEYDEEDTVFVRYRTNRERSGVQVVVPLRLEDGATLLVDRGWWPTQNRGEVPTDVPAPPDGTVDVVGRVRADATGDATKVTDKSTRAISSKAIAEAIDHETLGGFVQLVSESPEPEEALTLPAEPELDEGPHFFYGLQWWFFGAMAIFGFFYLLYDEWRDRRKASVGAQQAPVDGDGDTGQE
ncbi:SURF1 family protein [Nocardioides daphniae]|uniref:SURF1-like protein n=1 Tax=Nocardioides daphniae TaxID=402297 RepID=A0A4P7UB17_9ACTN|nr:SURF1 family protein [Nocardioides daphniae]QCC77270.1 SURF1 family protein [Nocardioides daphniae]GGD25921.1 SURF1-like protein [Nocardioides daphniae]